MNESIARDAAMLRSAYREAAVGDQTRLAGSAVSWPAIVAGAAAAAALSLVLLVLGVGLGLSSVSPWSNQGIGATSFGVSTILWISFAQLASSGLGGYLAGRLRTRWIGTHTDEVYFRDTAHGFLAWAVATLVTAAALTSTIASVVGGGLQAGARVAGEAAATAAAAVPALNDAKAEAGRSATASGPTDYFVDVLFRRDPGSPSGGAGADAPPMPGAEDNARPSAEAGRIFANAISSGSLSGDDVKYLGQVVAQRTGLSQVDAEKRVADTFARMQAKANEMQTAASEATDKARKASAYGSLWLFVSLLLGAFVASLFATFGGRRRDRF